MCEILIRIVIISRSQLLSESTPISPFKASNAFVYKCQSPSHRDVEDQRLVMVLINTPRLNNRLHSEPQT